MRIVHVITRLLRAGSEENTIATCLSQADAGHDVFLVHGNEWNPVQATRCFPFMSVIEISELVHAVRPVADVKAVRKLRTLFRDIRPDVVHTHQSKAGIVGRIAARLARVPLIVHGVHILAFQDVDPVRRLGYIVAERAVGQFTHAFISVSEAMKETCIDHLIGDPSRHFVAHSGMDIQKFRSASPPEDWRALTGTPAAAAKPPVVLMLAALEPRKRHVEFLHHFGDIVRRHPDLQLLLAGEGPARQGIEAAIAQLALGSNVRLLGYHAHPEQLIALSDLTVLTSMREGLPRVVIQSLAGGRPVVVTDLPGLSAIVQSGENGIIVPSDDMSAAAAAVSELFDNPARLYGLQENAARTDVSSWEIESMCSKIATIYELAAARDLRAPRLPEPAAGAPKFRR